MTDEKRQALIANGYREFRVWCPSRPELEAVTLMAPDEQVARNKYRAQARSGSAALTVEEVRPA